MGRRHGLSGGSIVVVAAIVAAALLVTYVLVVRRPATPPPRPARVTPKAPPVQDVPFSPSSPWITPIPADATPAPDSAAVVANLDQQIRSNYGRVVLNATQYTATLYTVDASQPLVNVEFDNCQNKPSLPAGLAKALTGVPIPNGAVGSPGSDSETSIYQPSANRLWEFWKFEPQPHGRYSACWGGEITDVSQNLGVFPSPYGATASGLPLAAFVIRINEVAEGEIDHALGIEVINARLGVASWPADRSDGNGGGDNATDPMEGQRFRLNPGLNLSKLGLNPLARMVARAIQKYGMIVTDQSTGALAIQAQDPGPYEEAHDGQDPYASVSNGESVDSVLQGIPWSQLQAMPTNYGRSGAGQGAGNPSP
jgi:hypothetical protein